MTISLEAACERILGEKAARSIIKEMGLRWAIVGAVSAAHVDDDQEALAELRKYIPAQKS